MKDPVRLPLLVVFIFFSSTFVSITIRFCNGFVYSPSSQRQLLSFVKNRRKLTSSASIPILRTTVLQEKQQQQEQEQETKEEKQTTPPSPVLNGKRVLPFKVMSNGIKGSKVAAIYAILNASYKRGSEGWDSCEVVHVTDDLNASLQKHLEQLGSEKVAHVRALSFSFPEPNAMEEVSNQWRSLAREAGSTLLHTTSDGMLVDPGDYLFDTDDEYDDDEDDDWDDDDGDDNDITTTNINNDDDDNSPAAVISPFETSNENDSSHPDGTTTLAFTKENVDKVLDEVRPYLVADGGNVSVQNVDEEKRNIYLKLEGACGSCPSSTVTMQMGIERVLKENFPNLGEVIAEGLGTDDDNSPKELTLQAVENEVNRLKPAIAAMGGVVDVVGVDSSLGVAELMYRGSNKVRQGLELAVLDLEYCNRVTFTMGDE